MEDFRRVSDNEEGSIRGDGNSSSTPALPASLSARSSNNNNNNTPILMTTAERVSCALRLLSASYHNLAAALQTSSPPSSQGAAAMTRRRILSDALDVHSLSVRARASAIRRDNGGEATANAHVGGQEEQEGQADPNHEAEDVALLGEVRGEIMDVIGETTRIEQQGNHAAAGEEGGGGRGARELLNGLDVYAYQTRRDTATADVALSSILSQQEDASSYGSRCDILTLKAPVKINIAQLAALLGNGGQRQRQRRTEQDWQEVLDCVAGLHAMALCHIEMANVDGERGARSDSRRHDNDRNRSDERLFSPSHKARSVLRMALDVITPIVVELGRRRARQQIVDPADRLIAVRAFGLSADVRHSFALVEYRSSDLDRCTEHLNASLDLRGEAGLQRAVLATTPAGGSIPANVLDSLGDDIDRGVADSLSLRARVHLMDGEYDHAMDLLDPVVDLRVRLHGEGSLQAAAARYNAAVATLLSGEMTRPSPHEEAASATIGAAPETREAISAFALDPRLVWLAAETEGLGSDPRLRPLAAIRTGANAALCDCPSAGPTEVAARASFETMAPGLNTGIPVSSPSSWLLPSPPPPPLPPRVAAQGSPAPAWTTWTLRASTRSRFRLMGVLSAAWSGVGWNMHAPAA